MSSFFFSEDYDKIIEMCNDENINHSNSCIGSAVDAVTLYGDGEAFAKLCPLFQGEQKEYCEYYYYYVLENNDLV